MQTLQSKQAIYLVTPPQARSSEIDAQSQSVYEPVEDTRVLYENELRMGEWARETDGRRTDTVHNLETIHHATTTSLALSRFALQ
jgi:hypothetical protein